MTLAAGSKLGRYEIRSKIGEGGMGEVYRSWDTELERDVALKVLPADVNSYTDESLSADSNTLLVVPGDWVSNLWVAPEGDAGRARRITSGKYDGAMGVAWTPDGRVVHASRDWDIWIVDADGQNQKLLTVDQHNNRWASVTPDGRYQSVVSVPVRGGDKFEFGTPSPLFRIDSIFNDSFDVTAGAQGFVAVSTGAQTQTAPLTVVVNWTADLKREQ